jgi:hypothetical protein
MVLGGVMLGAGMELRLKPADYLGGATTIHFTIDVIEETYREHGTDWVILYGQQLPSAAAEGWHPRRVQVRVAALKRSLSLMA